MLRHPVREQVVQPQGSGEEGHYAADSGHVDKQGTDAQDRLGDAAKEVPLLLRFNFTIGFGNCFKAPDRDGKSLQNSTRKTLSLKN